MTIAPFNVFALLLVTAGAGQAQDPPTTEEEPIPMAIASIGAADIQLVRDANGAIVKLRISGGCCPVTDAAPSQFLESVKNKLKAKIPPRSPKSNR